ncbi:Mitochondrial distribution and morphology protein 10 [Paramicrosporidium saccamoebae]|uniref:Mitochondrial distribution and morphology protein 10 n=1 Tax=Paramicrosporidium saccamoebae TaxID=1246581 RepID=A0A2H9TLY2_9FUNG|nr:Mitochondrial distribution and morphology protein 10 [Paramicrosporidium saccamoebae]
MNHIVLLYQSALFIIGIIDFVLPSSATSSISRRLSAQFERSISLELPTRRISLRTLYRSSNSLSLGRLWLDTGSLEAILVKRLGPPWTFTVATSITRPPASGSQLKLSMSRQTENNSLALCYTTTGSIAGCQYLYAVSENLRLGSDLYYTGAENSGGLSLGARWLLMKQDQPIPSAIPISEASGALPEEPVVTSPLIHKPRMAPMVATFLMNPLMGHLQMTLTSPIRRAVTASIRYDVNVHSFDADLAAGLVYAPEKYQQLRLRASWRHGIAMGIGGKLGGVNVRVGLASGPIWSKPTGIESVPTLIPSLGSPSIGFEVSLEH